MNINPLDGVMQSSNQQALQQQTQQEQTIDPQMKEGLFVGSDPQKMELERSKIQEDSLEHVPGGVTDSGIPTAQKQAEAFDGYIRE